MQKSASELLLSRTYKEVWERGEDYAVRGRVKIEKMSDNGNRIKAVVRGKENYTVILKFAGGGVRKQCDCAYSKDGPQSRPACKHMVAAAISWDESSGVGKPAKKDVKLHTMPPAPISRRGIIGLFKNPLRADLDKIRILTEYSSSMPQPHARLPNAPKIGLGAKRPLKTGEVKKALSEMEKWSKRSLYDPYFCAGEMSAAFCELLDVIRRRQKVSNPKEIILSLAACVDWFYRRFNIIVDGIEGVWLFPVARIGDLVAALLRKHPNDSAWIGFRRFVQAAGKKAGKDDLDEKIIAKWAKEKL